MSKMNHELRNRMDKVRGPNPATPPAKKHKKKRKKAPKPSEIKQMRARYPGTCVVCREPVETGTRVFWHSKLHQVKHFTCHAKPVVRK